MDISIFTYKAQKPNDNDLLIALGETHNIWIDLHDFVITKYPKAVEEWNFPGAKYGWHN